MDNLISASEFARRVDVPESTMNRWVRRGRVPGAVKIANLWLVPEWVTIDDIERPKMGRPPDSSDDEKGVNPSQG